MTEVVADTVKFLDKGKKPGSNEEPNFDSIDADFSFDPGDDH
jgi:hypothetical protein